MPRVVLSAEERLGTLLAGKYRFDRVLGKGGMGTVFGGEHTGTHRPVAIKVLNDELAQDEDIVERFLWEARAASNVRHPNVVDVLDVGKDDDGTTYMVLEWLEGESLADMLDREAPLPVERTIRILGPIMAALQVAHAAEIVHRDIKPENVFVSRDRVGRLVPKLLDFGVAKVKARSSERKTTTGLVIGTPQYMAPEQAIGDSSVGPQCDVWSIGAVLYECLSNTTPFQASSSAALLIALNTRDARPLTDAAPTVPHLVAAVVDRALVRDRDVRWPSMGQMLSALVGACDEAGVAVDEATRNALRALGGGPASVAPPARPDAPAGDAASFPPTARRSTTPEHRLGAAETERRSEPSLREAAAASALGDAAAPTDGSARAGRPEGAQSTGMSWSGAKQDRPSSVLRWVVAGGAAVAVGGIAVALMIVLGSPPSDAAAPGAPAASPPSAATRAPQRAPSAQSAPVQPEPEPEPAHGPAPPAAPGDTDGGATVAVAPAEAATAPVPPGEAAPAPGSAAARERPRGEATRAATGGREPGARRRGSKLAREW